LQTILNAAPEMQVVAQADNARDAIAAYDAHRPDITILDLRLPETECIDAIRTIRDANPQARIIILTSYDGEEDAVRGLRAGAVGYLLKDSDPQNVLETVRAVHAGKKRIDADIAAKLAERVIFESLSDSELGVLREMAEGKSNPQIAETLSVSESTVKFHINNILLKLNAANRTEAVVLGLKRGLIHLR
jgi:two-component system, NarL family, response regulator